MLFISRFAGENRYGVVDTDDWSEEVVTHDQLNRYCIDLGLDIKGAIYGEEYDGPGKTKPCVFDVEVYQHPDFVTAVQAKGKVLRGIDVKTYDGKVVCVEVDEHNLPKGVVLRLSDYGTSCGEHIFKRMSQKFSNSLLTVVLDDKIKIGAKSFAGFTYRSIMVDMREVTDSKAVWYICKEMATTLMSVDALPNFVIDSEPRMDFYKAIGVLSRHWNVNPEITSIDDIVSDSATVSRLVAKKFRSAFKEFSMSEFSYVEDSQPYEDTQSFLCWLSNPSNRGLADSGDYDTLRNSRFMDMFVALRELARCNSYVLLRFENYVKFFDVSDDIKQSFIQLCRNAGNWLYICAVENRWI